MADVLSITDLAAAAGVSVRAVRFYTQQRLLPVPLGRGRGSHYGPEHLEQLKKILDLQRHGHSLDAIRRILAGESLPAPADGPTPRRPATLQAQLWTRLALADGVELHYDATRHQPDIETLLRLKEVIRQAFDGSQG